MFLFNVVNLKVWLFLFDYLAKCFVEVVVIMFGLNEGDNCWGGQRVSMCRFRFKFYHAVVQRCRIICFKFMYWLRLGAVVPVWFCMSSILQYQSQFGTNWLNRCMNKNITASHLNLEPSLPSFPLLPFFCGPFPTVAMFVCQPEKDHFPLIFAILVDGHSTRTSNIQTKTPKPDGPQVVFLGL